MTSIEIVEASSDQAHVVALKVTQLLLELEPDTKVDLDQKDFSAIARDLLSNNKIYALLAMHNGEPIGVLTLHECAAIYAGGLFGEISELYVAPEYRSLNVGHLLIEAAIAKAKKMNWKRLEVGSPPEDAWQRTIMFYENNGFKAIGKRLGRDVQ